jgi:DNA polymerase-3 subunit epsilon
MDYSAFKLPVIRATAEEMAEHEKLLDEIDKASGGKTLWRQTSSA